MRFIDIFMLVSPEFAPSGANLHVLAGEHASDLLRALARSGGAAGDRRALGLDVLHAAAPAAAARRLAIRICARRSKAREATDGRARHATSRSATHRRTTSTWRRRRARPTSTPTPTSGSIVKFAIWLVDLRGHHSRRSGGSCTGCSSVNRRERAEHAALPAGRRTGARLPAGAAAAAVPAQRDLRVPQ